MDNLILKYSQPFCVFLPEIPKTTRKVAFREKALWTALSLGIFLICCQTPLFGISRGDNTDPLYWARQILASNRATLMELGISPIVTSSMITQLLVGMKWLTAGETPSEKAAFESLQKLMGFIITFVQSLFVVFSGMYGTIAEIGSFRALMILLQLNIAGAIVVLLDELVTNYGFGSGLNLFIATNVCENIIWRTFSPTTTPTIKGNQFDGALIQFFAAVFTGHGGSNRIDAIINSIYRDMLPGIYNIIATIVVFIVAIYFQGFKVDIKIQHTKVNTQTSVYPIKLFYTSTTPIMLQSTLVSNLFTMSQMIYNKYPGSFLSMLLGSWSQSGEGSHMMPVGGLCYYMNRPNGLAHVVEDPLHCLAYIAFMLITCAFFSITWLMVSGSQAKDVAKQLKDQQMMIAGHREHSAINLLNRYIPIAASFGGLCIGALSVFADFSGALGSGTSILLAVSIVSSLQETINKEQNESGGQSMKDLLFL